MHEHGLWIEVSKENPAIESLSGIEALKNYVLAHHITDLYVQVYREGRSWFRSDFADETPFKRALVNGVNPLEEIIKVFSPLNINIHAWFNIFNYGKNASAPIFTRYGEDILLKDNAGARIDEYQENGEAPGNRREFFYLDTPKLWVDPASDSVREFTLEVISEFCKIFPEVDVHLDFLRYPYLLPIKPSSAIKGGFDFGYENSSLNKFSDECRVNAFENQNGLLFPVSREASLLWDNWRRSQVTQYLTEIRKIIGSQTKLSVAALAWADRAYMSSFQDWRFWMRESLLDKICLMAYTNDNRLFADIIKSAAAFQNKNTSLVAGVGGYLCKDANQIKQQEHLAIENGARGTALFSYENLKPGRDS